MRVDERPAAGRRRLVPRQQSDQKASEQSRQRAVQLDDVP
jgi:hypothetical protein